MLVKLLAISLLVGTVLRLLLGARWKSIGVWVNRVVDTALIVLGLALVLQLVLLATRV